MSKLFKLSWMICWLSLTSNSYSATSAPIVAMNRLNQGEAIDLIVEYNTDVIESSAANMRKKLPRQHDDSAILKFKSQQYKLLKSDVDQNLIRSDIEAVKDYSHLPMAVKRFKSSAGLQAFLAQNKIKAVYENKTLHPVLTQSLPLINQPNVAAVGEKGMGTTVAVIDNGIDYTKSAFGACTAPNTPSTCHVVAAINLGTGTTDNSHGTNVSAIVLGVSPDSKIAMLNAFSGSSALISDVIAGINWAIANQATYNIVAINMSLGDGTKNTSICSTSNPFLSPVTNARNAGITVVAAAGNEAYTNAISNPACTPGVISVGAVYDANLGGLTWGNNLCTDATTAADKVTCFSDSASFLTILAPGALINAAGISEGGTSQASPHIAGAVAVLRSTFPLETLNQTQVRMTSTGTQITDTRNSIIKPRLNLLEAARPLNDAFSNRSTLSGNSGSTTTTVNLLSTKETGEANHAGNAGGHSIWWKWIAPSSGQLALDTHGSNFDSLLGIYTGTTASSLILKIANDNDGSSGNTSGLLLQVNAGQEYQFVVDGANGTQGSVSLNWNLNTAANANLSILLSGPTEIALNTPTDYTLTINNTGPQTATNVFTNITLPAGATFISGSTGCSLNATTISCQAGTINNGSSSSFTLQILWTTITGVESLIANTSSDLPDSSVNDNTATIQLSLIQSSDTPLPNWAMYLLATGLLFPILKTPVNNKVRA